MDIELASIWIAFDAKWCRHGIQIQFRYSFWSHASHGCHLSKRVSLCAFCRPVCGQFFYYNGPIEHFIESQLTPSTKIVQIFYIQYSVYPTSVPTITWLVRVHCHLHAGSKVNKNAKLYDGASLRPIIDNGITLYCFRRRQLWRRLRKEQVAIFVLHHKWIQSNCGLWCGCCWLRSHDKRASCWRWCACATFDVHEILFESVVAANA